MKILKSFQDKYGIRHDIADDANQFIYQFIYFQHVNKTVLWSKDKTKENKWDSIVLNGEIYFDKNNILDSIFKIKKLAAIQ